MKFYFYKASTFLLQTKSPQNFGYFLRLLQILLLLVIVYSVLFYYIMHYEGSEYSWVTCVYWTLTVMSTLGFGDITFSSNLGQFFTIIVLLSGVTFFLVMLPLTFIQYVSWIESQKNTKAPRAVAPNMQNHIIIIGISPLSLNLIQQLTKFGFHCVLLCPDIQTYADLEYQGLHVIIGNYDDVATYHKLRVGQASMLLALDTDIRNSNIIFSAREADANVPIVARAELDASVDILTLAGSTKVFSFRQLLGIALAHRVTGSMGYFTYSTGVESLVIAEASINNTHLVGKTLRESALRARVGVNVVGIWKKGTFIIPAPDEILPENASLVITGTKEQFKAFDNMMSEAYSPKEGHVIVLGAGRVGIAAARNLHEQGMQVTMVDKMDSCIMPSEAISYVKGDASGAHVLEEASIRTANSVIITTNDDDTNIYLTLYCRQLNPEIQIISRATLDRNVSILHGAGANIVLSLVSMMSNNIVNMLVPGKILMLSEGLSMFRCNISESLMGKSLMESDIRRKTRCNIVAILAKDGTIDVNPAPSHIFSISEELYIIGDSEGEAELAKIYDIRSF